MPPCLAVFRSTSLKRSTLPAKPPLPRFEGQHSGRYFKPLPETQRIVERAAIGFNPGKGI